MQKQQIKKSFKGFTLVELIMVITILAILGTIAYISFQGYTKDARDSSRMSDIKQLYNGISIYKTQTEKTPMPDNYVNILSGTTTISYQGYAGTSVLRLLKITGGKDPGTKDYYIYSTDVNQKKGQLMTFMETSDKDVQLLGRLKDLKLINQAQAVTNTGYYQDKKIYVYGDKIGILTDSNKVPLQETTTATGVNLLTTTTPVTTYFGGSVYSGGLSTSTGLTLINQINGAVNGTLPCSPTTYNSYVITSLQDKQSQTFTKTGTISGGTQTGSILATCNNGILSYGTESFQTSCNAGYTLSGNNCNVTIQNVSWSTINNGGVTLSNSNMTTLGSNYNIVYATSSIPVDRKVYWEIKVDALASNSLINPGVVLPTVTMAGYGIGFSPNGLKSWGLFNQNGGGANTVYNNVGTNSVSPALGGDTISFAIDSTSGSGSVKIWMAINNSWIGGGGLNPGNGAPALYSNLPADIYPAWAGAQYVGGSNQSTLNDGRNTFTYTKPSGFIALNGTP